MEYSFHIYNKFASDGMSMATDALLRKVSQGKKGAKGRADTQLTAESGLQDTPTPVIVCVGSDLAIGDCVGPITGSMLRYKTQGLRVFLYGTLSAPITAKEIRYMRTFLKETHKDSPVIAIDAAVGESGDIGLIKINDTPLRPGAGANKKFGVSSRLFFSDFAEGFDECFTQFHNT